VNPNPALWEDGWVTSLARPIAEAGGWYVFVFFVLFMLIGAFGILNLLTAVFIEEHCPRSGDCFVAHGVTASQELYAARDEEKEKQELENKKKKLESLVQIKVEARAVSIPVKRMACRKFFKRWTLMAVAS
jgi:hypothetical protein